MRISLPPIGTHGHGMCVAEAPLRFEDDDGQASDVAAHSCEDEERADTEVSFSDSDTSGASLGHSGDSEPDMECAPCESRFASYPGRSARRTAGAPLSFWNGDALQRQLGVGQSAAPRMPHAARRLSVAELEKIHLSIATQDSLESYNRESSCGYHCQASRESTVEAFPDASLCLCPLDVD